MGLPLPNRYSQKKPWNSRSEHEKVISVLDPLLSPFSQRTIELLILLVSLKTIEAYIEEFGEDLDPDHPAWGRLPRTSREWGGRWESRFPNRGGLLRRPPPHAFYTTLYLQVSMIGTRKSLPKCVGEDPEKYRRFKSIDEVVLEEDIMPALRGMREFARGRDFSCYKFIVVAVALHVIAMQHMVETFHRPYVPKLPGVPTLVRMDCFPFLKKGDLILF